MISAPSGLGQHPELRRGVRPEALQYIARVSLSARLARWTSSLEFDDLPPDVVEITRRRVLDIIGLSLAGAGSELGRSTRAAAVAMSPPGPCTILGTGDRVGVTAAALANGTFSQALEYDDTHNESIVHMSSPAVAASMALSEMTPVSGRDLITAIAAGNEVSCRVGSVAAGQFHKRGFHPTGLFGAFGAAHLSSRLLGLDADAAARAAGICGSFASGILECWADGTDVKFLHAGWAAQSGIASAFLARAGTTGAVEVFEGRFGLFASHLQNPDPPPDFDRIIDALGTRWDSRNSSFKPFPAAHVIHPYIDAVLRLRLQHGIEPADIERIDCPVAAFIVGIVCEPTVEKFGPATASHCRVSLQYTLAEAMHRGTLGKDAYGDESRLDPSVLALARRVHYHVDPDYPGPGRFKGAARITLNDGRSVEAVEEYNRGSTENPMSVEDLRTKFDENASTFLTRDAAARLADVVLRLETLRDASILTTLATARRSGGE
jgi:2-methylcitrate dehydratase PrpD